MNWYGVPPLLTSLLILSFGIISFTRKPNTLLNKTFSGFCFTVFIWAFSYSLMYFNDPENCVFFARLGYIGVSFIPSFALHFTLCYTEKERPYLVATSYVLSTIFLPITQTDYFLNDYKIYFWGSYPIANTLYVYFILFFMASFLTSVAFLFNSMQEQRKSNPIRFNQSKFVFLAYAIASTSLVDYIPNYGHEVYPFAYLSAFGWISLIAYATLRYRLMDFNLLLRLGLAYSISVALVTSFFIGLVLVAGELFISYFDISLEMPIIILAVVLALFIEPLKHKIVNWVDQLIFKSPDYKTILDKIEEDLRNTANPEEKSAVLSEYFKTIWRVGHAGFAIWDSKNSEFKLYPKESFSNSPISSLDKKISLDDFLIKTLETERRLFRYGIVIGDELVSLINKAYPGEKITFSKIRRTMRWIGAAICVPIMLNNKLIGFFILGPKSNHAIFNDEDRKFLSHLSSKVVPHFQSDILQNAI